MGIVNFYPFKRPLVSFSHYGRSTSVDIDESREVSLQIPTVMDDELKQVVRIDLRQPVPVAVGRTDGSPRSNLR